MAISRRQLIGVTAGMLAIPTRTLARECGAMVIVRGKDGIVAVDPHTGDTESWNAPSSATSAASPEPAVPDIVATPVTEGTVGYWMSALDDASFIFRLDTGASSSWWWRRRGSRAVALDLPGDVEPALPSGTSAMWFHGATIDASHLGAGTLRLLAVDLATGETVLDYALDRRLELAATKVSDDGAVVAHVQSATTGVAFWMADLRNGARQVEVVVNGELGLAAASVIDLAVAADDDAALAAAGLTWAWPGAPDPAVIILWASPTGAIRTHTFPGELIGIVPPGLDN